MFLLTSVVKSFTIEVKYGIEQEAGEWQPKIPFIRSVFQISGVNMSARFLWIPIPLAWSIRSWWSSAS